MTARGFALLVSAGLLWAVGRLLGVAELHVAAVACAALVGAGAVAVRRAGDSVSLRRSVATPRLHAGQEAEVVLELRNDGRLPASLLLVEDACHHALTPESPRFVVPGIAPGRTVTLRYPLVAAVRGRYLIGPARVRARDPFGAAERVRRYTATREILVYPRIEPLPDGVAHGAHHGRGTSRQRRLFTVGDEFYGLREYVVGDDLRQVHWRATAHRRQLMVRQQELAWQAQATILCDTRAAAHSGFGPNATIEQAISVAASLVCHLDEHDYDVRLVTSADDRPPAVERCQLLLDRLAELTPSPEPHLAPTLSGLRGGDHGLLAAVLAPPPGQVPVTHHPDVLMLLAAGRRFGSRLCVVVEPPAGNETCSRASQLAAVLSGAGWRATTLSPGQGLAGRFPLLAGSGAGRNRAATR